MTRFRCRQCAREYESLPDVCECGNRDISLWEVTVVPSGETAGALPSPEVLQQIINLQLEQSLSAGNYTPEQLDETTRAQIKNTSNVAVRKKDGALARIFPVKGDPVKEIVRKIVMDVSFVVLVGALIYLGVYFYNYRSRIKDDKQLNLVYEEAASKYEDSTPEELALAWEELRASYPDVDFPEGMNIKFAQLYAVSSDVVGWLSIENTKLSTVLLQTDNNYYYLYRDIHKNQSRYGSPFVNAECSMGPDGLSKNTIIYGHNTHDKLIFNVLENYMTVDGYLSAPIITLDTLYSEKPTKWKIFAVMLTNADAADDNGYVFDYLYSSFSSGSAFVNKMNQIKKRSMITTGVDIQPDDKTLMLYTCYRNYFDSGRLVIVARQLREGESEDIDVSLVGKNRNAIYPAAYYN